MSIQSSEDCTKPRNVNKKHKYSTRVATNVNNRYLTYNVKYPIIEVVTNVLISIEKVFAVELSVVVTVNFARPAFSLDSMINSEWPSAAAARFSLFNVSISRRNLTSPSGIFTSFVDVVSMSGSEKKYLIFDETRQQHYACLIIIH